MRRRVKIDEHTELIMRNQLKGWNCDFYKERTAIGISTGREGRERHFLPARASVWSLERAAGISLSRETESETDRQRERETCWHQLQRFSEHLPGLNSVCLSLGSCISSVKGFTTQLKLCLIELDIYDIINLSIVCIDILMLNLSKKVSTFTWLHLT